MVNELNALESRIAEVVSLCRSLRAENIDLRQALALERVEKQGLATRMQSAFERLNALAQQLPDSKEGDVLSDA